jgi:Domain of unknown function (DUF4288)
MSEHSQAEEQPMSWFAAHVIMAVKLKNGQQSRFPVWENVVLIEARSEDEAFRKAEELGRRGEGDDDGTFRWGGKAATWLFAGVRKLTECAYTGAQPGDGSEITYNEIELESQEAVASFAAGEPVPLRCNDRFRDVPESSPAKPSRRANRKRA